MTNVVPYFVWRNGKPRWVPSPHLRAKGHKGFALVDDHGNYLPLAAAMEAANAYTATVTDRRASMRLSKKGSVYFLFSGQGVKIGFTTSDNDDSTCVPAL